MYGWCLLKKGSQRTIDGYADGMSESAIKPPAVNVMPLPSQVVRLQPVVALVYGGGTSAVLMCGQQLPADGGVRVSVDGLQTSAPPTLFA